MLHSGIGRAYDPQSGEGVVGRNYAYQCGGGATAFFDDNTYLNQFMGSGGLSSCIDDFNGGAVDIGKEGYIGGGGISCASTGARPIQFHPVPRGTPRWASSGRRRSRATTTAPPM